MTGRTVGKWVKVQIDDTGGVMRDIPVLTIGDVGLTQNMIEISALQDAVKGFEAGVPGFTLDITGPFSDTAVSSASGSGAAASLSGSHTVLNGLPGGVAGLGFAVYIGMLGYWATNDPTFGISGTATNGVYVTNYQAQPETGMYSAQLMMKSGSAAPAWGTAVTT